MKNKKKKPNGHDKLTLRTGEQFWKDLMNTPYTEDKVGQSFIRITWKRLPETDKYKGDKK